MTSEPIDVAGLVGPVVRPVVPSGARSAEEIRADLAPSIGTYGGGETHGVRTVQHWALRFGDVFVADTSSPAIAAMWRAVIDERSSLLAEVERLTAALTEVGDGFDDLTDSWRAQFAQLTAVEALVEQARKVSPSASMTVYVGDLEKALGRRPDAVRGIVGAES